MQESQRSTKKRGRFEGAIRIPLHSLMLFFNDLALLRLPLKSLKFLMSLFSIPTAPTNLFCFESFSNEL
jgi:hypothetical protein